MNKQNPYRVAQITVSLFSIILLACGKGESDPIPTQTGEVKGTVKDERGNPYPGTVVTVYNGSETTSEDTDEEGAFSIKPKDAGDYDATLLLPLSTEAVTSIPVSVNVQTTQNSTVDFVIQPQPVEAHLNFGTTDIFGQVRNKDGILPTQPDEPLYARNTYQEPIGFLKEIKAPDGHTVTLAEFSKAKGTMLVRCNGNKATVDIALTGLIPNGTYTVWLAYLNTARKVGESIGFNDFVYAVKPPLGSSDGSENVLVAGPDGAVNITKPHSSCILTDEAALVIPVIYMINGKTFGGGEIPDAEQVVQLLVYFQ